MSDPSCKHQCDRCNHIFQGALWIDSCPNCRSQKYHPVSDEVEIPPAREEVSIIQGEVEKFRTSNMDEDEEVPLITSIERIRVASENPIDVEHIPDDNLVGRAPDMDVESVDLIIKEDELPPLPTDFEGQLNLVTDGVSVPPPNFAAMNLVAKEDLVIMKTRAEEEARAAQEGKTVREIKETKPPSTQATASAMEQNALEHEAPPPLPEEEPAKPVRTPRNTDEPRPRFTRRSQESAPQPEETEETVVSSEEPPRRPSRIRQTSTEDAATEARPRFTRRNREETADAPSPVSETTEDAPRSRFSRRNREETAEVPSPVTESTEEAPRSRFSRRNREETADTSSPVPESSEEAPRSRFSRRNREETADTSSPVPESSEEAPRSRFSRRNREETADTPSPDSSEEAPPSRFSRRNREETPDISASSTESADKAPISRFSRRNREEKVEPVEAPRSRFARRNREAKEETPARPDVIPPEDPNDKPSRFSRNKKSPEEAEQEEDTFVSFADSNKTSRFARKSSDEPEEEIKTLRELGATRFAKNKVEEEILPITANTPLAKLPEREFDDSPRARVARRKREQAAKEAENAENAENSEEAPSTKSRFTRKPPTE